MPENNDVKSASKRKSKEVEKRKNDTEDKKNTKRFKSSPELNDKSSNKDEYRHKRDRSESRHKEEHRKRAHEMRTVDEGTSRKRSRSPSGKLVIVLATRKSSAERGCNRFGLLNRIIERP
jgi:hypothetical protein